MSNPNIESGWLLYICRVRQPFLKILMLSRHVLALVGIASASTVLHAQDYSKIVIKVTPLSGSVYMLEGAGGNIGLSVGSDDAFLIDDQFAPLTPKIRAAIATVTGRPVRFLLNTHWHGDHTGGNENMAGVGAIVLAQENVRHRMSTEQFLQAFKLKVPASPRSALPIVTFSESITLYVNDDSIAVVHVPHAHTDGDAIVFFQKANVIHMGDTFFNGRYPLIDLSSGGSVQGMIAAADRALKMSNSGTRFIPGHGPLANRDDLVRFRDMLRTVTDRVAKSVAQGRTLTEVLASKPSNEYDAQLGNDNIKPDQFVSFVYASFPQGGLRGHRPLRH